MNTMFQHKDSNKQTWTAMGQRSNAHKVLHARVFQGPEKEPNHFLLVCSVCKKLRWYKKKQKSQNPKLLHKINPLMDPSSTWLYCQLRRLTKSMPINGFNRNGWPPTYIKTGSTLKFRTQEEMAEDEGNQTLE